MKKQVVVSSKVPLPTAPYSQAIKVGNLLFVSGQGPFGANGKLVSGDIQAQVKQTLENIKSILLVAGASMEDIIKTTVYLRDMRDFEAMNEVYRTFFGKDYPARSTVQANLAVEGQLVEIEAIAYCPEST